MTAAAFPVTHGSKTFSPGTQTSPPIPTVTVRPSPLVLFPKDSEKPYTLLEKVGKGSYGDVWKALTPRKTHLVAMKIPYFKLESREEALKEANMHKAVQGAPHILQLRSDFALKPACYWEQDRNLCIGCTEGDERRRAIVMDLLPCKDMFELFIKPCIDNGPTTLTHSQILSIGKQALETLRYFQSIQVVHRDIKPSNMTYHKETGEWTLFDFGYAETIDRINPDEIVPKRRYRAPEMLLFKSYNEDVDMWSLGVSLFMLYTGKPLFPIGDGEDTQKTIDHLFMIIQIMGEAFSQGFIESVIPRYRDEYFKRSAPNRPFILICPPSKEAEVIVRKYDLMRGNRRATPIWKAHIHETARLKGESASNAESLIALIGPMLLFEGRIKPEDALRRLFSSSPSMSVHLPPEETKTEKITRQPQRLPLKPPHRWSPLRI